MTKDVTVTEMAEPGFVDEAPSPATLRIREFYNLTVRQSIFVVEFIRLLDEKQAALAAGYKKGEQPVMSGAILAAIRDQLRARMERTLVTGDRVVAQLSRVAFNDRVGPQNQLKALDMLMRHFGLYAPQRQELDVTGTLGVEHTHDLSKLSTEELERLQDLVSRIAPSGAQPPAISGPDSDTTKRH